MVPEPRMHVHIFSLQFENHQPPQLSQQHVVPSLLRVEHLQPLSSLSLLTPTTSVQQISCLGSNVDISFFYKLIGQRGNLGSTVFHLDLHFFGDLRSTTYLVLRGCAPRKQTGQYQSQVSLLDFYVV